MTFEMDAPTVLLTDDRGRSLLCSVEHSLNINGHSYALLLPVHTPVDLFSWEDEESEVRPSSATKIAILGGGPNRQAVLEEQNLSLQWSAITLTVEGELPDLDALEWELDSADGTEDHSPDRGVGGGDTYDNDLNGSYAPGELEEGDEEIEEFRLLARF